MSKVYFTDFRTQDGNNLLQKLERLIKTAGIEQIDFKDKFTAIKIHFGERGNLSFLRPNYSKVVVDLIKEKGGKPFLTDSNTLYVGGRANGIDHLDTAYENGYNPFATNAHVVIADGIKGTDEALIDIDGEYIKQAKIGRAIADADVFISMTHFKGHELTGFGGTLKNIGMGSGSKAGKKDMHSSGKPTVNCQACKNCKKCAGICAHSAISFDTGCAEIDKNKCTGCGRCIAVCPFNAIDNTWNEANDILNKKIAEYTLATINNKPAFHISFIVDVSPNCDCHFENDMPIVPNIGILASFDPVSLDMACVDLVNAQKPITNSMLGESDHHCSDHFTSVHPETNWIVCLDHAEKLGIGTKSYELIKVK